MPTSLICQNQHRPTEKQPWNIKHGKEHGNSNMINVKMWIRGLRIIPRVTREEWHSLDVISRWIISTRAAVFIMTALSAALGGIMAYRAGQFNYLPFILCMIGLIFAHAANNLLNDWVDYQKGIDQKNYYRARYGPQPLVSGLMSETELWLYICVSFLIASIIGLYLIYRTGGPTVGIVAAGIGFLLFYTWPLKYIGMGEPTVILVWGPLMVGGSYLVTTGGSWSWEAVLIGVIYALGPTTVLFGKHTDKLKEDKVKGVHSLPVIIGQRAARYTTIGLWITQFALVVLLVALRITTPVMLIVLIAVIKFIPAVNVFAKPRPDSPPKELPDDIWPLYLSARAFVYNRFFGILFLLALIADTVLIKMGVFAV